MASDHRKTILEPWALEACPACKARPGRHCQGGELHSERVAAANERLDRMAALSAHREAVRERKRLVKHHRTTRGKQGRFYAPRPS